MTSNFVVNIKPNIRQIIPLISLGVLHYEEIIIVDSSLSFREEFHILAQKLFNEYSLQQLAEQKSIKNWRSCFKKLGIDYSRYRPSSEALTRRILSNKSLYWINAAVDINNYLSVLYGLPFGIYDLNHIQGAVFYRLGLEGESYLGLNGREFSVAGKPILSDNLA